jgi:hypothetical protein
LSTEWWVGAPPAEATVACGPNQHRLRWTAGRLLALDHADPAVDVLLAELGGEEPACLALCRYWTAHAADAQVLMLAGRHPGDTLGLTAADVVRVRSLIRQDDSLTGGRHREANEHRLGLIELLAVDPAIGRRLQSEVAHNLAAAQPLPDAHRLVLEAATVGRLTPIARRWSGDDRPLTVDLGDHPGVRVSRAGMTVTVRPDWLAAIWGRYLGVVDHFLVVDVHRIVEGRTEVTAVASPGGAPARLLLRGPAPWHVERRTDDAP